MKSPTQILTTTYFKLSFFFFFCLNSEDSQTNFGELTKWDISGYQEKGNNNYPLYLVMRSHVNDPVN